MKKIPEIILLLGILIFCIFCAPELSRQPADLVLLHGKILTMNPEHPEAEAIAIKGETLLAVGAVAEIEPYIGSNTQTRDLGGNLTLPGLIEGHGHYMSLGRSLMELDLKKARTWDEIVAMVADVNAADTTITMNGDYYTITANFEATTYDLTLVSGWNLISLPLNPVTLGVSHFSKIRRSSRSIKGPASSGAIVGKNAVQTGHDTRKHSIDGLRPRDEWQADEIPA